MCVETPSSKHQEPHTHTHTHSSPAIQDLHTIFHTISRASHTHILIGISETFHITDSLRRRRPSLLDLYLKAGLSKIFLLLSIINCSSFLQVRKLSGKNIRAYHAHITTSRVTERLTKEVWK